MTIRTISAAALLAIGGVAFSSAFSPSTAKMQESAPGVVIGAKAPVMMALRDSSGAPATLTAKMGAKGMLLVMLRSASWCPYCKAQLIGLNDASAQAAAQGYPLVSLTYDKPEVLAGFAKSKSLRFAMLSDEGSKFIDAVRLRDPQYASVSFANGVPYPTVLVLSKDGKVVAKNVSLDYKVRPTNAQILAMIPVKKG